MICFKKWCQQAAWRHKIASYHNSLDATCTDECCLQSIHFDALEDAKSWNLYWMLVNFIMKYTTADCVDGGTNTIGV